MKKFQKISYTAFSSPNANLSVIIEAQAQKKNQAGDLLSNAYISSGNNIYNNIPIYVVLEYKNELQQGAARLYLSYPNMEDFKETIHYMRKNFSEAFGKVKNDIVLKPEYEEGILIDGIGQNNNWAQFKYVVCSTNENGIDRKIPSIALSMSVAEGFVSILTEKEIKHLDYLFQNINLVDLAWNAGISYIDAEETQYQTYTRQQASQPRQEYFRQSGTGSAPRTNPNTAISRISSGNNMPKKRIEDEDESTPFLPPRSASMTKTTTQTEKPQTSIVNMKNIDDVEIGDFSLDNDSDIDDIFN